MISRLGNVFYWIGCLLAVITMGLNIAIYFAEGRLRSDGVTMLIIFAIIALGIWAIGWASRYVLVDRI
jgi:hypothetical protein